MSYEIRLEVFEGPFDLLLHLIDKNQVDIYDIPIAEITRQYLGYLDSMEELDLEIASSFLVMAANLLLIKARMLLPSRQEETESGEPVDERAELVRDLLEYISYKKAADALEVFSKEENKYFDRPNNEDLYLHLFEDRNPFEGKTLSDLTEAFRNILKEAGKRPRVFEIVREEITINDKMRDIIQLLKENHKGLKFSRVFQGLLGRIAMVVTFLALLELVHQGVVRIRQGDEFGEIFLYPYRLDN